jgi:hypothetical protein
MCLILTIRQLIDRLQSLSNNAIIIVAAAINLQGAIGVLLPRSSRSVKHCKLGSMVIIKTFNY